MAEHNFTQQDDERVSDNETAEDPQLAESGLDDLIARVRAQTDESGPAPADSADTAGAKHSAVRVTALSGRSGRLVERWVPAALTAKAARSERSSRRRLATIGLGAAVTAGLLTGAALWSGGPVAQHPVPPSPLPLANVASTSDTHTSTSKAPETVVVSVVGKVAEPGLVTLPSGARVADALHAAGGLLRQADRRTVNLARTLVDGEQLYVGVPVPAGASKQAQPSAAPASRSKTVNLNTASAEQLETLPGVGDVTAKHIIEWRTEHGGFSTVEQLRQVDGIGDKRLADLRDLVNVR